MLFCFQPQQEPLLNLRPIVKNLKYERLFDTCMLYTMWLRSFQISSLAKYLLKKLNEQHDHDDIHKVQAQVETRIFTIKC